MTKSEAWIIAKKWAIILIPIIAFLIVIAVTLFYPEHIYVDLWIYIGLIFALLFMIFAIFRWGGENK